jgi:hypothetical protein
MILFYLVPPTIGYLDLRSTTLAQVGVLLLEKLKLPTDGLDADLERAKWAGDFVEYNGVQVASFWPKLIENAQHAPVCLVTLPLERIRYGNEKQMWNSKRKLSQVNPCHDCAALPGQYHVPGCDMEECRACGRQSISCGCRHESISRARLSTWEEGDDD